MGYKGYWEDYEERNDGCELTGSYFPPECYKISSKLSRIRRREYLKNKRNE